VLCQLTASDAAAGIRAGEITSVELVSACLDRISETEEGIGAWETLDRDSALGQAEAMDDIRRRGLPVGPLHGVPVGIKDIFDTADLPTQNGSPAFAGRRPDADAAAVSRLKEAGAVIMGKTVTTEFAFMHPAATRNPHDPGRTPGGSSSGSAAAVAAGHVPLAIGSQTGGSVIRPASFCGVYGLKPTRGVISRAGALKTSECLDHVGVFARSLPDAGLIADVLSGYDRDDMKTYARPKPAMLVGALDEPPVEPVFAWFDLPFNDRLTADAKEGFEELVEALGGQIETLPAPAAFATIVEDHQIIHEYEICHHLREVLDNHWDKVSDTLKPVVERARGYSRERYAEALAMVEKAEDYFASLFVDYDAVLCPSATGEAPPIAEGTGDPIFCKVWTFAGLPCISLPLLVGTAGLPVGVQLVGSQEGDDRLLRTAAWLERHLVADDE